MSGRWVGGWRVWLLAGSVATVLLGQAIGAYSATGAGRVKTPAVSNCLWELSKGASSTLRCVYPAWLADSERAELRRLTRDRLQDAHCNVSVDLSRALVVAALRTPDHVFLAPPQPVRCEIETNSDPVTIEATFAPRVVIKDGVAVDATPGLANVTGVNKYIAWPVVEYINRSSTVRDEMLKMINAYLGLRVARGN